ncbi:MAG TPA: M50 family metallopeptidase [Bacilli bacterium]|nr:M50 family metallopeptidase [Bacilli bacterium]
MTLIYFILMLGIIIFFHELGHFFWAKKYDIYVYEFSLGFGPKLFSFKRKNDETEYILRLIPIGGYIMMAGEETEDDKEIPANMKQYNKTWLQRFITIVAGALNNFILGFLVLFIIAIIYGSTTTKPYIGKVEKGYPAYSTNLKKGDLIIKLNNKKVYTWDDVVITFALAKNDGKMKFYVKDVNSKYKTEYIKPIKVTDKKGNVTYKYGILANDTMHTGFVNSVKYASSKFCSLYKTMFVVIKGLFTGEISVNNLSGPVGIYSVVGESREYGFDSVLYLLAYLSINIGFVNLLPFPAFDGGRVLFLVIEKIKGSKVKPQTENMIHQVGLYILFGLMIYITAKDIFKLF